MTNRLVLLRYLEERPEATIDEAAMVGTCLVALGGDRQTDAARTLRAMAGQSPNSRPAQLGQ
jgi:hypothetical protein